MKSSSLYRGFTVGCASFSRKVRCNLRPEKPKRWTRSWQFGHTGPERSCRFTQNPETRPRSRL